MAPLPLELPNISHNILPTSSEESLKQPNKCDGDQSYIELAKSELDGLGINKLCSEAKDTRNSCSCVEHKILSSKSVCDPEKNTLKFSQNQCLTESDVLFRNQLLAAFAGSLCHFGMGGMFGFPGIVLPGLMDPDSPDLILNKVQASFFASSINLGTLIGSLISGVAMTWFGQKRSLVGVLPIGALGWLLLGLAPSFEALIVARLVLGVVTGIVSSCANNYIVEMAHTSVRGRLLAMTDLLRQMGVVFIMFIGSLKLTWRQVAFVEIGTLVIPFVLLLFLPDSPRWLATKGRREDAHRALTYFRGKSYNVDKELQEICVQLGRNKKSVSVKSQLKLLGHRQIFPTFVALGFLLLVMHFTGNMVTTSYSVVIFESTNTGIDPYMSSIVATGMRVVGSIAYIVVADKFNRKSLFGIPLFFAGVSMTVLGIFFYIQLGNDITAIRWLPLASVASFTFFTSLYYPALMLLRGELLPTSVRSLGSGIHFCLVSIGMFAVTSIYPYMVDSMGSHWTFWIYGFVAYFMVLIIIFFIPETKGKTLEEIGEIED